MAVAQQDSLGGGVQFTRWAEIPKSLLEWRAGAGSKPKISHVLQGQGHQYGVYLLGECASDEDYSERDVILAEDPIIYVGKAGLQTLYERWTNTHAAWNTLGKRHQSDNRSMRFFYSFAIIRCKETTLRAWSEEVRVRIDAVYVESLEQATCHLLRQRNPYYQEHNIAGRHREGSKKERPLTWT